MSHIFVSYKEHDVRIHDLDFCVICHLISKFSSHSEMSKFFTNMDWIGPGVLMGTDLESFLNGDDYKTNEFVEILNNTQNVILELGSTIPLSFLRDCKDFVFSNDYPSAGCVLAIKSIIKMLKSG